MSISKWHFANLDTAKKMAEFGPNGKTSTCKPKDLGLTISYITKIKN